MIFWLWVSLAQAHPFGARFAAHRLELRVGPEAVHVTYLADVPNPLVRSSVSLGGDPMVAMMEELASGLRLVVDGEPRRVVLGPESGPLRASSDSQLFRLVLSSPLTNTPHEIVAENANLPEVPAYFNGLVLLDGGVDAVGSSLVTELADGRVRDRSGRWQMSAASRRVSVRTQPRPIVQRWLDVVTTGETTRGVGQGAPVRWHEGLTGGHFTSTTLVSLMALVLGGAPPVRCWWVAAMAVVVGVCLAAVVPVVPLLWVCAVGAVLLLVTVVHPRSGRWGAVAWMALVVASTGYLVPALFVAGGLWIVSQLVRDGELSRSRMVVALGLTAVLCGARLGL